ncbi:MAG: membrane dipeptidase [Acidobacteria bacterium]|nr:MAG: membrane dipeptidase [Acidobacteriota bacterium]
MPVFSSTTNRAKACGLAPLAARAGALLLSLSLNGCHVQEGKLTTNEPAATPRASGGRAAASDAATIHRRAIAIDMHADTVQFIIDEGADINRRLTTTQLDAVRMREGGLDAQFFSIWVEPQFYGRGGPRAVARADEQINAIRALADEHPETWTPATTAADIRRTASEGKLAALMGLEGGYAIDEKLESVGRYYRLGVRYMSPTWTYSLSWAGSSGDAEGQVRGLNDFGRKVIHEMNRLGMLVDVSHVSDKTFWDIVEASAKPVIATHSNCRGIANVPRNLTDEMIRAIAKTGGVVCVVFYPGFVEPGWMEKKDALDAEIKPLVEEAGRKAVGRGSAKRIARDRVREREYAARLPAVPVARVVDHIDHIVRLVGVEHVGVGSDFDGIQATPAGLSSVAELPNLTAELLRRGYSEEDVDKILGGNILRVMEEVERGAER